MLRLSRQEQKYKPTVCLLLKDREPYPLRIHFSAAYKVIYTAYTIPYKIPGK